MSPRIRNKPKDWPTLIKAYWPIAIGLGALLAWIVISTLVGAWLERNPEHQLRRAALSDGAAAVPLIVSPKVEGDLRIPRNQDSVRYHFT